MARELLTTSLGPVSVSVSGTGPLAVLLHANPGDARDWDSAVPSLIASGWTIAQVDWPGYGASPAPLWGPGPAFGALGFARVLDEVLDQVVPAHGGGAVVLVGNSVGGFAAVRQALLRPERVRGLVLIAPGGFTRFNPVSRLVTRVMGSPRWARRIVGPLATLYTWRRTATSSAALRRPYAVGRDPQRLAVHCDVWRSFLDPEHDLRARARGVAVPTLVTWGRGDPVLPWLTDGRRVVRTLPDARLALFWSGHEPHAEVPQQWLAAVKPFLADLADLADPAGEPKAEPGRQG